MKHGSHLFSHLNQTAIYSAMIGSHNGTLLNTRDGRQWFLQVSPSSNAYVNDVARALIALKSSTAAILSIRNNRLVHRPKSPAYVAVDVLVLHDADNEFPVEIGGIVFAPGTNNIYSVFHKTLDGVVEDREEFSGLRILDRSRLATSFTQTITSLHEWIKTVAPLGTLLFWGPTNYDLICVHLSDYECIDIKEYYLYWNANSGSKKGEKQTDDTLIEATWKRLVYWDLQRSTLRAISLETDRLALEYVSSTYFKVFRPSFGSGGGGSTSYLSDAFGVTHTSVDIIVHGGLNCHDGVIAMDKL
ncbi:hypothetical protein GLOIN_2v1483733 [Rhizophagus irregularis DAOM 181602=DAOM 197198]|nr:hypothetical protein GLOIN_2v1483733 [Rhizophagus irregularis DAOM 181602=DAOM 197198]